MTARGIFAVLAVLAAGIALGLALAPEPPPGAQTAHPGGALRVLDVYVRDDVKARKQRFICSPVEDSPRPRIARAP